MADPQLLERAARCYERAGLPGEAARCYRDSGAYRRSAEIFLEIGELQEAADDFARGGLIDVAAWTLVHRCGDPAAARAVLATDRPPAAPGAEAPSGAFLRRQVVLARCAFAEGAAPWTVVATLTQVCDDFARQQRLHDAVLEGWCIDLAEVMGRDDQVALIFAAAVRGQRAGARQRWEAWSRRVLGADLILPRDDEPAPVE